MANFKSFLKAGHPPTLFASFLYFDFCFAIWVLNGAMAPFIKESFHLTPQQAAFMISLPTLSGALMRFPLGVLSQYIGRKNAALVEMSCILVAMAFGYFFVDTYDRVLAMGVLLGIAGASFGVALALGSGWFPPEYKGLAMGIAGAGNSGTAIATLFAPLLATRYGWQHVYGFAGLMMLLPFSMMLFFAKEPPDREESHSFLNHIKCLWQADGWMFNAVYIITFGGFIGLATYLPSFFHDQFGVTKVQAGVYTTIAAFLGSGIRIVGGYVADRLGGIVTLSVVMLGIIGAFLATSAAPSLTVTRSPLHVLLRRAGNGQRRAVPTRAVALARDGGGGGQHDRGNRRARRRDPAQRPGLLQAAHRQLRGRLHRFCHPGGRGALIGVAHRATLLDRQVDRARRPCPVNNLARRPAAGQPGARRAA